MENNIKICQYTIVEFNNKGTRYRTTLNDEGELNDENWEFLVGDSWEPFYLYSQSRTEFIDTLKQEFNQMEYINWV